MAHNPQTLNPMISTGGAMEERTGGEEAVDEDVVLLALAPAPRHGLQGHIHQL